MTGRLASTTDASMWVDFDTALRHVRRSDGLGIVLTNGLCGVDLDYCRDAETGAVEDWALDIVRALDSYTETSPSGTGLHVLCRATLPPGGRRRGSLEMYDSMRGRFFCVTGQHLADFPSAVEQRQAEVEALHARVFGENGAAPPDAPISARSLNFSDQQLLQVAFAARNGDRIRRLFHEPGVPQGSEGDAALCGLLAFYAGTANGLERLMRASSRARLKWDELRGEETWIARECRLAIGRCREFYSSTGKRRKEQPHDGDDSGNEPQVLRMMRIAAAADLFRDANDGLWTTVPVGDHRETFPLAERGEGIRHWLTNRFCEAEGKPPSSSALGEAVNACVARAPESPVRQVALRIVEAAQALWLDLANSRRQVVRITGDGWQVTSDPPATCASTVPPACAPCRLRSSQAVSSRCATS